MNLIRMEPESKFSTRTREQHQTFTSVDSIKNGGGHSREMQVTYCISLQVDEQSSSYLTYQDQQQASEVLEERNRKDSMLSSIPQDLIAIIITLSNQDLKQLITSSFLLHPNPTTS